MNLSKQLLGTTLAVLLGSLALSGCGDAGPPRSTTSSTAVVAGSTTTSGAAVTSTTAAPTGRLIETAFRSGKVEGPSQVDLDRGQTVTLRVTSDVAEEAHVHSYDLKADLEPGVPAEITFRADIAGRHEVELENNHHRLLTLVVGG